jgi:micrococcal nuclease
VEDRRVRLELDVQARDRYGRLLAYVWVGDTMVNAELLRLGMAQVMTVPPNVRHQALFLRLERAARAARRGLWGAPA